MTNNRRHKMHRKDIEAIERVFKEAKGVVSVFPSVDRESKAQSEAARVYLARKLARALQEREPNFRVDLFLKACEVAPGPVAIHSMQPRSHEAALTTRGAA